MDNEKPYKTPSLTINNLSAKLFVSSKQLSQIINECLRQNFFDFVNFFDCFGRENHFFYIFRPSILKKKILLNLRSKVNNFLCIFMD